MRKHDTGGEGKDQAVECTKVHAEVPTTYNERMDLTGDSSGSLPAVAKVAAPLSSLSGALLRHSVPLHQFNDPKEGLCAGNCCNGEHSSASC